VPIDSQLLYRSFDSPDFEISASPIWQYCCTLALRVKPFPVGIAAVTRNLLTAENGQNFPDAIMSIGRQSQQREREQQFLAVNEQFKRFFSIVERYFFDLHKRSSDKSSSRTLMVLPVARPFIAFQFSMSHFTMNSPSRNT
jgi:hypothetical protein